MYSVPIEAGFLYNPTIANPSAGNDFLSLLPNNKRYQISSLKFEIVTDANVANRYAFLQIMSGATVKAVIAPTVAQAASTTFTYQYFIDAHSELVKPANNQLMLLPASFYIPGNWNIQSNVLNLQAGDQIQNIELICNSWVERTV